MLEDLVTEGRLACRRLIQSKRFAGAALLTLATGIAGPTVMFTLISGILLRPLPIRDQDRVLVAWTGGDAKGQQHWPFLASDIDIIRDSSLLLEQAAGVSYNGAQETVAVEEGMASYLKTASVSGNFFEVLGV